MSDRSTPARRLGAQRLDPRKVSALRPLSVAAMAMLLAASGAVWADQIELVNGSKYEGKLVEQTSSSVTFRVVSAGGAGEMTFPAPMVKSVTLGPLPEPPKAPEEKAVPQPPAAGADSPPKPASAAPDGQVVWVGGGSGRSPAEINALIEKAGTTPPEWWDSVKLDYPETLDLVGNVKPQGWAPTVKLGAYFYSIVNGDPTKWRSGIKLLHHVLTVRKNDPKGLRQAMDTLARSYFTYEKDYARTAYWLRKAAQAGPASLNNMLRQARCYHSLGNTDMARQLLTGLGQDRTYEASLARAWAQIGETKKALEMAEAAARAGSPDGAYLAAGDICRRNGDYEQALAYYNKVLALTAGARDSRYLAKNKQYARAGIGAVEMAQGLDLAKIPDGAYAGSAQGFRKPVDVKVTIKSGRITAVEVTRFDDDFSLGGVESIPTQIVERQSIAGVDTVTCATVSSRAILNAAGKALASAAGK